MNTAQSKGFSLDDLDSTDVQKVTFNVTVIEDEDGNPKSGFVIMGKNSPEYQQAAESVRIANIMRSSKRTQKIDASTQDGAAVVARTIVNNERTLAMAVVVGWYGFDLEGQPRDFDKSITEKLLTKYPTWMAKVQVALDTDANFMKS